MDAFHLQYNFPFLLKHLEQLRQGVTKYGLAPHKPVLLLSLIDYMEETGLTENQFLFDERLLSLFKKNWHLLVTTNHVSDITKPLHYLQTDKIWSIDYRSGFMPEKELSSYKKYQELALFGSLLPELFEVLRFPEGRETIRLVLLSRYFPKTESQYFKEYGVSPELLKVDESILQEPQPSYSTRKVSIRIYEGYVRDVRFRRQVLSAYNHTCAMTGYHIFGAPIIEACHIIDHARTGDNSIQNGLALCANLHTAFDSGLISLDSNYCILVKGKNDFQESEFNSFSLRQLKGRKILLPDLPRHYPIQQYLKEHRQENGF